MVRAHVAALGGNAVVSYIMKQCVFMENPNKNQAQCLINVSGDAVVFVRESELEVVSTQQPTANCQSSCTGGEVTTWSRLERKSSTKWNSSVSIVLSLIILLDFLKIELDLR